MSLIPRGYMIAHYDEKIVRRLELIKAKRYNAQATHAQNIVTSDLKLLYIDVVYIGVRVYTYIIYIHTHTHDIYNIYGTSLSYNHADSH